MTKKTLFYWREQLLTSPFFKTASHMYLSEVRTLFQRTSDNGETTGSTIKQSKPKKQRDLEASYTDAEAVKALNVSRSHETKADEYGRIRETPKFVRAQQ